ncbi:hypothetical protein X801_02346, partial [Opisthorchis viverrini]
KIASDSPTAAAWFASQSTEVVEARALGPQDSFPTDDETGRRLGTANSLQVVCGKRRKAAPRDRNIVGVALDERAEDSICVQADFPGQSESASNNLKHDSVSAYAPTSCNRGTIKGA